ncbi:ABC transporter permease [Paenibacillus sp. 481]|uniref:ABC transporter permease n=1 Tax=Paenibacillus sp. 481 TaxID=2835869 RepID=UPI001E4531C7|nr:ABC transporter permease [Paenibacillus sp. 481]UHA75283.1 ABC transporter permease [Paenibacillus sp. 481]
MEAMAFLLNGTFVFATALIFAALGGLITERTGVVNLGLEGFMVAGAFSAAVTAYFAEQAGLGGMSAWIGFLSAPLCALLFALMHAIASVRFKADQVISGIVVNMLAASSTFFLVKLIFDGAAETPMLTEVFGKTNIPFLSDLPFFGVAFFQVYPTTIVALILVVIIYFVMFKTPLGLRMRAVGEHPGSADTAGIRVNRLRFLAVLVGGMVASLGGATIALTANSSFSFNTISGQGFIALAAVIFGRWHPIGAMGAALFFGLAQALKDKVQLFEFAKQVPTEVFYMLPYVLTLIVLIFTSKRTSAPAALGQPYDPGKR